MMARMPVPEERLTVDVTSRGPVGAAYARPTRPFASLVVAHGAGAGMDHPFLTGFTRAVNELGVATLRFNFPYVEAGRRSPDSAPVAIAAWRAAFDTATSRASAREAVWAGGKSFGGRMASMAVAEGMPAAGLVFLGYPLHPPGRPDRIRADHLFTIEVPMLFVQGSSDPFASRDTLAPVLSRLGARATLHTVEGGGHSLELSRKDDPRATGASLAEIVASFIREHRPAGR
jgi:predicted alpha/beta-hydrolase family hydrolase